MVSILSNICGCGGCGGGGGDDGFALGGDSASGSDLTSAAEAGAGDSTGDGAGDI